MRLGNYGGWSDLGIPYVAKNILSGGGVFKIVHSQHTITVPSDGKK